MSRAGKVDDSVRRVSLTKIQNSQPKLLVCMLKELLNDLVVLSCLRAFFIVYCLLKRIDVLERIEAPHPQNKRMSPQSPSVKEKRNMGSLSQREKEHGVA